MRCEEQVLKLMNNKNYSDALILCEELINNSQKSHSIKLLYADILHKLYRYREAFNTIRSIECSDETLIAEAAIIVDWCSDFMYKNTEAPPCDTNEFLKIAVDICDKFINEKKYKFDAMYTKGNALAAIGQITESRLLLHQAEDNAPTNWGLLVETIINLGNSYQQEGRFIEAIEFYEKAIKRMPDFSMGWSGLGSGLSHAFYFMAKHEVCLLHMSLYCFYRAEDLVDYMNSRYVKAIKNGLDYVRACFIEQPEKEIVFQWNPFDESKIILDTSNTFDVFYHKCLTENSLFLNLCLGCRKDEGYLQDNFLINKLTSEIEDSKTPYNLFSYFAEIRRDYIISRWFYIKSQFDKDQEMEFLNSIYEEIDLLDYTSCDLKQEVLKVSLQRSVGIFDKIAFFLNEYEELNIPHHRVWFSKKGNKDDIFNHIEKKYKDLKTPSQINLQALKSISTDLKHPYFEASRNYRDSITHKYLKVHLDFAPIDSLFYPGTCQKIIRSSQEKHDDITNPKNYHITESDLKKICLRTLKMARAAIFYLSGHVNCNERNKEIKNPNKIIPSLYFDNILKHNER